MHLLQKMYVASLGSSRQNVMRSYLCCCCRCFSCVRFFLRILWFQEGPFVDKKDVRSVSHCQAWTRQFCVRPLHFTSPHLPFPSSLIHVTCSNRLSVRACLHATDYCILPTMVFGHCLTLVVAPHRACTCTDTHPPTHTHTHTYTHVHTRTHTRTQTLNPG